MSEKPDTLDGCMNAVAVGLLLAAIVLALWDIDRRLDALERAASQPTTAQHPTPDPR